MLESVIDWILDKLGLHWTDPAAELVVVYIFAVGFILILTGIWAATEYGPALWRWGCQ